jgi:hypothetical protein
MKNNMMELSKFVKWSVTGDGYVGRATHNLDAHYAITRLAEYKEYVELIASKLESDLFKIRIEEYQRKSTDKTQYTLRTTSHPLFSRIRDRQYIDGHRVIDPHMLTFLDYEMLSFLYQDDGSLCYNKGGTPIVRLSTCSYSFFEHEALRRAFMEKLELCFNINKCGDRFQLNLAGKDMNKFFDGIHKYILPCYSYKLPGSSPKETSKNG